MIKRGNKGSCEKGWKKYQESSVQISKFLIDFPELKSSEHELFHIVQGDGVVGLPLHPQHLLHLFYWEENDLALQEEIRKSKQIIDVRTNEGVGNKKRMGEELRGKRREHSGAKESS